MLSSRLVFPMGAGITSRSYSNISRIRNRFLSRFPCLRPETNQSHQSHIVVVGSGWASLNFLKYIDHRRYRITFVSPKPHFTFSPLLPSLAAGTVAPNACIEPVRNMIRKYGHDTTQYYQGLVQDIDVERNVLICSAEAGSLSRSKASALEGTSTSPLFELPYDFLVMGSAPEDPAVSVPGVKENAYFLQDAVQAEAIRNKIIANLELACLPSTSEEEKERLLHFVCVGGGPNGVEFMAEVSDFIQDDVSRSYPDLLNYVRLTLVETSSRILPEFSERVSEFSIQHLRNSCNVNVLVDSQVEEVSQHTFRIKQRTATEGGSAEEECLSQTVPYGLLLWATGRGQSHLAQRIAERVPAAQSRTKMQMTYPKVSIFGAAPSTGSTSACANGSSNYLPAFQPQKYLRSDQRLKLHGTSNVYSLGDCSIVEPHRLQDDAEDLIRKAGGSIPSTEWLRRNAKSLQRYPQLGSLTWNFWRHALREKMTFEQFRLLLREIDEAYRPPAPTAQNARQVALYLASVFNDYPCADHMAQAPAFRERWLMSFAYVGRGQAVAHVKGDWDILGGFYSLPLWKAAYMSLQVSWRSRMLCLFDWLRVTTVGRDITQGPIAERLPSSATPTEGILPLVDIPLERLSESVPPTKSQSIVQTTATAEV